MKLIKFGRWAARRHSGRLILAAVVVAATVAVVPAWADDHPPQPAEQPAANPFIDSPSDAGSESGNAAASDIAGPLQAAIESAGTDPATPIYSDALNLRTRFWIGSEYLIWWVKGNSVPALVTTSPDGTSRSAAGVLPNAQVLFGNERVDTGMRSGLRLTAGYWLDADHDYGIQADYFTLGTSSNPGDFFAQSQGSPILARPFFNTSTGAQDAGLVAFPNVVTGMVQTSTSSYLESSGVSLRRAVRRGPTGQIDLTGGYRQFIFNEALGIQENLTSTNPHGLLSQGTTIGVSDSFVAHNNFQGGEVGTAFWFSRRDWTFDGAAKVGLGDMNQVLTVNGSTVVTTPGGVPARSAGGLLALPSNSGQFTRNQFSALPQLNLNLRKQFLNNVSVTIGYSLLFATNVMRTGDQIDTHIASTQLPTASGATGVAGTHPAPLLQETTLWAQGISFGVEYRR